MFDHHLVGDGSPGRCFAHFQDHSASSLGAATIVFEQGVAYIASAHPMTQQPAVDEKNDEHHTPGNISVAHFRLADASVSQKHDGVLGSTFSTTYDAPVEDDDEEPISPVSESTKKGSRPCKGKRIRYKKLVERLKDEISAHPTTFQLENVVLPPSLMKNEKRRFLLMDLIERHRHQVQMGNEPIEDSSGPLTPEGVSELVYISL